MGPDRAQSTSQSSMRAILLLLVALVATGVCARPPHAHEKHHRKTRHRHTHHAVQLEEQDEAGEAAVAEAEAAQMAGSLSMDQDRERLLDSEARWKLFAYQLWKMLPSNGGQYRTWRNFEEPWTVPGMEAVMKNAPRDLETTVSLQEPGMTKVRLPFHLVNDLVNVYLVTPAAARHFDEFVITVRNHWGRVEGNADSYADQPASDQAFAQADTGDGRSYLDGQSTKPPPAPAVEATSSDTTAPPMDADGQEGGAPVEEEAASVEEKAAPVEEEAAPVDAVPAASDAEDDAQAAAVDDQSVTTSEEPDAAVDASDADAAAADASDADAAAADASETGTDQAPPTTTEDVEKLEGEDGDDAPAPAASQQQSS